MPATVTPVGSTQILPGQVWQVSPIIDPQTRQGMARIALPYDRELRPGGFAAAEIRAGAIDRAAAARNRRCRATTRGNFVYIVDNDNKVVRRDVTIGEVTDHGIAIASGLTGNERVVLSRRRLPQPGPDR